MCDVCLCACRCCCVLEGCVSDGSPRGWALPAGPTKASVRVCDSYLGGRPPASPTQLVHPVYQQPGWIPLSVVLAKAPPRRQLLAWELPPASSCSRIHHLRRDRPLGPLLLRRVQPGLPRGQADRPELSHQQAASRLVHAPTRVLPLLPRPSAWMPQCRPPKNGNLAFPALRRGSGARAGVLGLFPIVLWGQVRLKVTGPGPMQADHRLTLGRGHWCSSRTAGRAGGWGDRGVAPEVPWGQRGGNSHGTETGSPGLGDAMEMGRSGRRRPRDPPASAAPRGGGDGGGGSFLGETQASAEPQGARGWQPVGVGAGPCS